MSVQYILTRHEKMLKLAESSQLITFPLSASLPPFLSGTPHILVCVCVNVCIFSWVQTAEWAWGRGSTNTPPGHCTGIQLYNNRGEEKRKHKNAGELPVSLMEKFSFRLKTEPLILSFKVYNFWGGFRSCKKECHPSLAFLVLVVEALVSRNKPFQSNLWSISTFIDPHPTLCKCSWSFITTSFWKCLIGLELSKY